MSKSTCFSDFDQKTNNLSKFTSIEHKQMFKDRRKEEQLH